MVHCIQAKWRIISHVRLQPLWGKGFSYRFIVQHVAIIAHILTILMYFYTNTGPFANAHVVKSLKENNVFYLFIYLHPESVKMFSLVKGLNQDGIQLPLYISESSPSGKKKRPRLGAQDVRRPRSQPCPDHNTALCSRAGWLTFKNWWGLTFSIFPFSPKSHSH